MHFHSREPDASEARVEQTRYHGLQMTYEDGRFFENLFGSLEREMNSRFDTLESEVTGRFDRMEARLDRMDVRLQRMDHSLTNGARQLIRMMEWSEKQDQFQSDTIRRLDELDARIRKLENNGKPN